MTQQFVIRVKQLWQGREVVKSFKMNVQNLHIHLQFVSPFRSDSGSQKLLRRLQTKFLFEVKLKSQWCIHGSNLSAVMSLFLPA